MADPVISFARTTDDVRIAWSSVGSGPALLHLPGVPFSNLEAEWRIPVLRRTFDHLARDIRFVQFDGRGTGRSQRDVADLSLDAMLRDVDAVVDPAAGGAPGLDRFAVLGFYASVTHAIAYAARHPDRVSRLVLFGGSSNGQHPMSGAATQALLSLIERDWDTFVESATHAWLGWPDGEEGRRAADWFRTATTPVIARRTLEAASGIDVTAEMAAVQCPVLVLHRRDAPVIPLAFSEALAAGFARGELRIVDGSSASLFFEHNEVVADEIVGFVTGRAAGEAPAEGVRAVMPGEAPAAGVRAVMPGAAPAAGVRAVMPGAAPAAGVRAVMPVGALRSDGGAGSVGSAGRRPDPMPRGASQGTGVGRASARLEMTEGDGSSARSAKLSPRELEVLRLVAAGESNGEIAARLGISINTVERHVANLYRKIDARGRADATAWAIRSGLA